MSVYLKSPIPNQPSAFQSLHRDDIRAWRQRVDGVGHECQTRLCSRAKFDGLTVVLTYTDGVLTIGATRATRNRRRCDRQHSHYSHGAACVSRPTAMGCNRRTRFTIRGEVVMLKKDFEAFQTKMRAKATFGTSMPAIPRQERSNSLMHASLPRAR